MINKTVIYSLPTPFTIPLREVGALPYHLDVPLQELLLTENCSGVATVQKITKSLASFSN